MDAEVLSSYLPLYIEAFFLTLKIGWLGIILSFLLGVVSAFIMHFKIPVLSTVFGAYVEVFRNTPLLIQLFFIYFGLPKIGIALSADLCGIIGLGLLGGSYMSEAIRSGLDAVSAAQIKSALALGMKRTEVFELVVFPEALTLSVPAIVANVIFLLKETSVFSAISLMDLMFTAKDLIGLYYDTTEALVLLVIFYMIMLLPVSFVGSVVEKKAGAGMFGE